MRFAHRSALAALSVAVLASCIDASQGTSPAGKTRASMAIVPRFSNAALTSATLSEAGLDFDHVRLVIIRPASDTLKDTTLVFTPTSAEVTLELSVTAVPSEQLVAGIQFTRKDTVLFSGTANVTAVGGTQSAAATPVKIDVAYTGPGASAKTLTIQPGAGLYSAMATTQFSARAFDGATELPNTPVFWSVDDESKATISSTGLLTPKGNRGRVVVTAETPNEVSASVNVDLAPAAVGLRVVQGASQKGPPGSTLPLPVIIEAIGADGLPAPGTGLTATFTASSGAQIAPATVAFDASGRAQATMTLGSTPGTTYIYSVTAGGFSLSWGGISEVGAPTHFVPSGSTTLTLTAGVVPDPIPTLRVADANENSVPGLVLKVTIRQNGANVVAPFNVPADSIGLLEVYRVAPTVAGTYTVLVEADPSLAIPSITYTITIEPGPAAKLAFTRMPTTVVSNQTVSPAITVTIQDQFGNTVTSAASNINLAMDPATGADVTLNGTGSVAPVNGVATFSNVQFSSTTAKSGVKIKAIGASLPAVLSSAFSITLPPTL